MSDGELISDETIAEGFHLMDLLDNPPPGPQGPRTRDDTDAYVHAFAIRNLRSLLNAAKALAAAKKRWPLCGDLCTHLSHCTAWEISSESLRDR
jgi:hypothetical protein